MNGAKKVNGEYGNIFNLQNQGQMIEQIEINDCMGLRSVLVMKETHFSRQSS